MKQYWMRQHKDSADAYVAALESVGYTITKQIEHADFILFDSESVGWRREMMRKAMRRVPGFIYPHTPFTSYLWDGIYKPLPVSCNFVSGPGQKECMRLYGYKHRVEVVGFSLCELKLFQPTDQKKLLFIPARPRNDKGRQGVLDLFALNWIIDHRDYFDSVTVCVMEKQFSEIDLPSDIELVVSDPKRDNNPAQTMADRIDDADIVISVTTPAALAVARGKATIMYGQDKVPETLTGQKAKRFEKYKHLYQFPLTLEDMSIGDVLEQTLFSNPAVEAWRHNFIGQPFDSDKFISTLQHYL